MSKKRYVFFILNFHGFSFKAYLHVNTQLAGVQAHVWNIRFYGLFFTTICFFSRYSFRKSSNKEERKSVHYALVDVFLRVYWKEILFKNTSFVQYQKHNSKSVSILRVHVHCTTVLFCAMAWKLKLMSSLSPGKLQPGQTCKTTANVWLGWPQNEKCLNFWIFTIRLVWKALFQCLAV